MHGWGTEQREGVLEDFINEARIEARLTLAEVVDFTPAYGLVRISDALECTGTIFDFEVPVAKEWLSICGGLMRSEIGKRKIWKAKDRNLWKGDDLMTEKRWKFWKKRLAEISDNLKMDVSPEREQETRNAAKTALAAMEVAETLDIVGGNLAETPNEVTIQ